MNNYYKLILVDDEEEVRKGVLKKIEWEKYGFQVVGEAENGKEALEIIEKTSPDVVVTDIKMPFMDGLELATAVRERYPSAKIIVLTGFDEFEYAQKSVKLNVMEYLLKPISAQELTDILIKVREQIDKEIAEKEDIESLRDSYRKSLPVLKEKFLTSLVTTTIGRDEIREKSESYGINLEGRGFTVSVVSIDKSAAAIETSTLESDQGKLNNGLLGEKELMKFAVLNIVEETAAKHSLGTAFLNNDHIVLITVGEEEDKDAVMNITFAALDEIRQAVERYLRCTVTIGVGNVCQDITQVNRSYQNAVAALDYRLLMGNNRIIWIEDIEPERVDSIVFDEVKERSLASVIKVGTKKEIELTIDKFFEEIRELKASFKDYQIYLMEMLTTILKTARSSNVDVDNIFGSNRNLLMEFYTLSSIDEFGSWFKDISVRIMDHIVKDRQDTSKLLVEKAKEYVRKHYQESDVTINSICEYLHLSPTYFSFIFKRDTKTTFINYLTQVRMEAAKELLRNTSMKAFEIAERIGYSEPNYFSYSFKKKFGVSPSEYRNSSKK